MGREMGRRLGGEGDGEEVGWMEVGWEGRWKEVG